MPRVTRSPALPRTLLQYLLLIIFLTRGHEALNVLLSLCNSYTVAANDAREANQIRYNEVPANWTEMISTSHDQFDVKLRSRTQAGLFLTDLDSH